MQTTSRHRNGELSISQIGINQTLTSARGKTKTINQDEIANHSTIFYLKRQFLHDCPNRNKNYILLELNLYVPSTEITSGLSH